MQFISNAQLSSPCHIPPPQRHRQCHRLYYQTFTASGSDDRRRRQTTISHTEGRAGCNAQRNEVNGQHRESGMSNQQRQQWQRSSSFNSESLPLPSIVVDDENINVRTRTGGIGARGHGPSTSSSSRVDVAKRTKVFEVAARRCQHFKGQQGKASADVNVLHQPTSGHHSKQQDQAINRVVVRGGEEGENQLPLLLPLPLLLLPIIISTS